MADLAVARMAELVAKHGTADPFELAAAEGVYVEIQEPQYETFVACSYPVFAPPLILVSAERSWAEQVFLCAYELYHCLFDSAHFNKYLRTLPNDIRRPQMQGRAAAAAEWLTWKFLFSRRGTAKAG